MPFKARSRHDAAATSADNGAGKQCPSGTPTVASEVPTSQVPTYLTINFMINHTRAIKLIKNKMCPYPLVSVDCAPQWA